MTFAFSQTTESFTSQIPPEEVNLELISQILSDQSIEFEMDEDTIHVVNGLEFDAFITIDDDKNLIDNSLPIIYHYHITHVLLYEIDNVVPVK